MTKNKNWAAIAKALRDYRPVTDDCPREALNRAADLCEHYARGELVDRIETCREDYCSGRRAGHIWSLKTGVCMYCDTRKPWP